MSSNFLSQPLIPGLPDDIANYCLSHLPFPYHFLARSVSSSWNRVLSSSAFLCSKSLLPYLFIFACDPKNLHSQWLSLNPRSLQWFVLPPMHFTPDFENGSIFRQSSGKATFPHSSKQLVLGGFQYDNLPAHSVIVYYTDTNTWSVVEPPGEIQICFGEIKIDSVERWEPGGIWQPMAGMGFETTGSYDVAVIGPRIYMMEVRFYNFTPKAVVYDWEKDNWEEMKEGMREGWTGPSFVAMGRLFIICELDAPHVKVYNEEEDDWHVVDGGDIPAELQDGSLYVYGSFNVCGSEEGIIYVVGKGLDVAVGEIVTVEERNEWKIEWNVVKGPPAFSELTPYCSLILYS